MNEPVDHEGNAPSHVCLCQCPRSLVVELQAKRRLLRRSFVTGEVCGPHVGVGQHGAILQQVRTPTIWMTGHETPPALLEREEATIGKRDVPRVLNQSLLGLVHRFTVPHAHLSIMSSPLLLEHDHLRCRRQIQEGVESLVHLVDRQVHHTGDDWRLRGSGRDAGTYNDSVDRHGRGRRPAGDEEQKKWRDALV